MGSMPDAAKVECGEHLLFVPQRKMKIVCAGAGMSGIIMAYKMEYEYGLTKNGLCDFVVYEKNDDVGGTWYENQYPGAACDNPAHCYNMTFNPNPNWSHYYCGAKEIHKYIRSTVEKFDLGRWIELQCKVVGATWDETEGKWNLKVDKRGTIVDEQCDVFLNACGFLNNWTWPKIDGLFDFKGHIVHSAKWDDSYDFTGKTVCLIGNGSSGIQITPHIQKVAKHMTVIIRSTTWISPTFIFQKSRAADHQDITKDVNFEFTEEEKERFRNDKAFFRDYRKSLDSEMQKFFYALIKDSPQQKQLFDASMAIHKERLANKPELFEKLTPTWSTGCRRLSPGDGYLESLSANNVDVVMQTIQKITPEGMITADGVERKFDALILATGFDTSFPPRFPLIGRDGRDLRKEWASEPKGYFGMAAEGFPNYFIFMGPSSPVGHGSLIPMMECTADYIIKVVQKMLAEQIKAVDVKSDVIEDYWNYSQSFMPRTVWTSPCRSWYKGGTVDGAVTAMYPGSAMHYRLAIKEPRWEDYNISRFRENRFQYFGNGFTEVEENGGDLSAYLD